MRTRERKDRQLIRTVSDIFRDNRARLALCILRTTTDIFKENYGIRIRPALTYGSECWAVKVNNKRNIATTERSMLRGIIGVSRWDPTRNKDN